MYEGACAEYCGTQHANMLIRAVVEPEDEFAKWIASEQAPAVNDASLSAQREVFESLSCVNCHTVRGTAAKGTFGPDLTHFASRRQLGAGIAENTPENLRRWLADPHRVKPGVNMPNFNFTDEQLTELVAYLETLK